MCVGALLESDVEALVFAVANTRDGAAGTVIQLAQHPALPRRIKVVSGIRRDEAEALFATARHGLTDPSARSAAAFGIARVAERAGFEPAMGCPEPHFQCGAIVH